MEKVIVHCPKCSAKIRVSHKVIGQNRPCPKCNELFLIQSEQPVNTIETKQNKDNEFAVEFTSDPIKSESSRTEVVVNQSDSKVSTPSGFFNNSFQNKRAVNFVFSTALVLFVFYSLKSDGDSKKTNKEMTPGNVVKEKVVKKAKPAIYIPNKKKDFTIRTGFTVGGNKKTYRKKPVKKEVALTKEEQYQLGRKYDNGTGVTKNLTTAIYWYTKAADQGHLNAKFNLGCLYANQKNDSKAAYWYEKTANQGDKEAQNKMGYYYQNGKGVRKNIKTAVYWFKKSAKQGDADSQNSLGAIYYNGYLGYKNIPIAYQWFTLAAKNGDKIAAKNLKMVRVDMANRIIGAGISGFHNSNSGGSSSSGFDHRNPDDAGWLSRNSRRMHGTH